MCALSGVRLFAAPWTVTCQAPLAGQNTLLGKNTGAGCVPSLAGLPDPGIQPTSRVSHIGRQVLYQQRHLGSPRITK